MLLRCGREDHGLLGGFSRKVRTVDVHEACTFLLGVGDVTFPLPRVKTGHCSGLRMEDVLTWVITAGSTTILITVHRRTGHGAAP